MAQPGMVHPMLTYLPPMSAQNYDTELLLPPYSDLIRELYNSRAYLRPLIHTDQKHRRGAKAMKKAMKGMKMVKRKGTKVMKGMKVMRGMKAMKGMKRSRV